MDHMKGIRKAKMYRHLQDLNLRSLGLVSFAFVDIFKGHVPKEIDILEVLVNRLNHSAKVSEIELMERN